MKLYGFDKNGKKREVKDCFTRVNDKVVKIKKGSPAWYEAVNEAIRQGVLVLGS